MPVSTARGSQAGSPPGSRGWEGLDRTPLRMVAIPLTKRKILGTRLGSSVEQGGARAVIRRCCLRAAGGGGRCDCHRSTAGGAGVVGTAPAWRSPPANPAPPSSRASRALGAPPPRRLARRPAARGQDLGLLPACSSTTRAGRRQAPRPAVAAARWRSPGVGVRAPQSRPKRRGSSDVEGVVGGRQSQTSGRAGPRQFLVLEPAGSGVRRGPRPTATAGDFGRAGRCGLDGDPGGAALAVTPRRGENGETELLVALSGNPRVGQRRAVDNCWPPSRIDHFSTLVDGPR